MKTTTRVIPETPDDQVITKHFADLGSIRLAVIRAIRNCHYERKRARIRAHLR